MTAWTTEARVAVAIAYELGLDWARWARGETLVTEPLPGWRQYGTRVPDPLDVEAYRTDCARRGVELGPLPAVLSRSEHVGWYVRRPSSVVVVELVVGDVRVELGGSGLLNIECGYPTPVEYLELATRLCRAAKDAMR